MLSLEAKKDKEMSKSASFLPKKVGRITLSLIALCLLTIIIGCGSSDDKNIGSGGSDDKNIDSGGSDDKNNLTASLTVAQRIAVAEGYALLKGCRVADTDKDYFLFLGEENNYFSKTGGDYTALIETVPSDITIDCDGQIHNFVFANDTIQNDTMKNDTTQNDTIQNDTIQNDTIQNDTIQSDNVIKANQNPIGEVNEFFQTDKKTQVDVEAYLTEKLDSTSLCRFLAYPAFTGTIIESTPETLSVTIGGKDCGTPQWYINNGSAPAASESTLVAGTKNLLIGENSITVKVTNPTGISTLNLKRSLNMLPNEPATDIVVRMTPDNAGTTVLNGSIFCSITPSITGSFTVTDPDGGSVVVTTWSDKSVVPYKIISRTIKLPRGTTRGKDILTPSDIRFTAGHTITFEATADGVRSNIESSGKIACLKTCQ